MNTLVEIVKALRPEERAEIKKQLNSSEKNIKNLDMLYLFTVLCKEVKKGNHVDDGLLKQIMIDERKQKISDQSFNNCKTDLKKAIYEYLVLSNPSMIKARHEHFELIEILCARGLKGETLSQITKFKKNYHDVTHHHAYPALHSRAIIMHQMYPEKDYLQEINELANEDIKVTWRLYNRTRIYAVYIEIAMMQSAGMAIGEEYVSKRLHEIAKNEVFSIPEDTLDNEQQRYLNHARVGLDRLLGNLDKSLTYAQKVWDLAPQLPSQFRAPAEMLAIFDLLECYLGSHLHSEMGPKLNRLKAILSQLKIEDINTTAAYLYWEFMRLYHLEGAKDLSLLEKRAEEFKDYYDSHRDHISLEVGKYITIGLLRAYDHIGKYEKAIMLAKEFLKDDRHANAASRLRNFISVYSIILQYANKEHLDIKKTPDFYSEVDSLSRKLKKIKNCDTRIEYAFIDFFCLIPLAWIKK